MKSRAQVPGNTMTNSCTFPKDIPQIWGYSSGAILGPTVEYARENLSRLSPQTACDQSLLLTDDRSSCDPMICFSCTISGWAKYDDRLEFQLLALSHKCHSA
jgi:hypothetical protein